MFRLIFPLFFIGVFVIGLFLVIGAFNGMFDNKDHSIRSAKKNSHKEDKDKNIKTVEVSANFDAMQDKYDNKYSGSLEKIYKKAYLKQRAEIVENFAKEDVRKTLKHKAQTDAGYSAVKPAMIGNKLTTPAEIELYQKLFVQFMSDKSKIDPYEEKEYQVIKKEEFFKGFTH